MKKALGILTTLSILVSALVFMPSASAIGEPYDPSTGNGDVVCSESDGYFSVEEWVIKTSFDCAGAIVIPEGITRISAIAFNATSASSFVFPSTLRVIEAFAFSSADGVTQIVIPEGVTSIGESALSDMTALTSLSIPASVTSLGTDAFANATALTRFSYCGSLTDDQLRTAGLRVDSPMSPQTYSCATAPAAPTDLTVSVGTTFAQVSFAAPTNDGGQSITRYRAVANPGAISADLTGATVGGTITLTGLTPGTSYTFTVTAFNIMGESQAGTIRALTNGACSSGGTFYISDGYVTRSDSTCAGIVQIPNGVTAITSNAFKDRLGISSVIIPDSVTSIGQGAFENNYNMTSLSIGNGVTSISPNAFKNVVRLGSVQFGIRVVSIGNSAFYNANSLTSLTIPDSVTTISDLAFYNSNALTSISFGSSVTSIGSQAFIYAPLISLTIPSGLTTLGSDSFSYLPQTLTRFTYCGSLLSEAILTASGVTEFGRTKACTSLTSPAPPIIGTATATGPTTATVSFTQPVSNGGSEILSYTARSTPGSIRATITQAGSGTISFTGLTAGTSYTFTVEAVNGRGTSRSSGVSNSIRTAEAPVAAPVYVAPTPVPYLKTLTSPKLNLKEGKLVCTPGTYNSGYTLDGVIQGSPTAIFSPSGYTYNLLFNNVVQTPLAITSAIAVASWDPEKIPAGTIASCSVTVTFAGVSNTNTSMENSSSLNEALSTQTKTISSANSTYAASISANLKAYKEAPVNNRLKWRSDIEKNRTEYYAERDRIKSLPPTRATRTLSSAALKAYTANLKKLTADYKASGPAALAAKDGADKAALAARDTTIAKANAAYGTAIELMGYGVLVP